MSYYKLVFKNLKRFLALAWKREPIYFLWLGLNFAATGIFTLSLIQAPSTVIAMAQAQTFDVVSFTRVFATMMLSGILMSLSKIFFTPKGYKIRYYLMEEMVLQNLTLPLEVYESPDVQNETWTVFNSVSGTNGVQGFYLNFGLFAGNIAPVFVSAGILYKLNIWMAVFVVGWFVIYTGIYVRYSKKSDRMYMAHNAKYREGWYLNDLAADFANAKEIRVYGLAGWLNGKIGGNVMDARELATKTTKNTLKAGLWDDAYRFVRDVLVYGTLVTAFLSKSISLAELSSYTVMIAQLNNSLQLAMTNFVVLFSMHENFDAMFHFLDMEKTKVDGESFQIEDNWVIEFKDVSFKYPNSERFIYENLNLTIRQGKKIALVGLNGTGKTTLIKLLLRLYRPTEGEILINGQDIQTLNLEEYMRLFAPVFQEINVFAFSLKDNLLFDSQADDAEIQTILSDVGLAKYSDNLDREMTNYVSEDGIALSGGESQKLAMARAILAKRPVLLLDEPTSALDAIAEYEYYTNINEKYSDKTILFISHRLASTRFCDEIVMVGNGTILEQGTHDELMVQQGIYHELFEVQAKYYKEDIVYDEES